MPRAVNAKMRILKIAEILSNNSSPEKPISSSDILRSLEKHGVYITRTTLKNDIATLSEWGIRVRRASASSGERYYLEPKYHTRQSGISESIKSAMLNKKQIYVSISGYTDEYEVSPYAILSDADGFYAVCYSELHRRVILLPLKKILSVRPGINEFVPPPPDYCISYYIDHGFELRQSARETITLGIEDDAIGEVRSYFGDEAQIYCASNGLTNAAVNAEINASFFTWIFSLGGRVRIVSPEYACREYKNNLRAQLARC